MASIWPIWRDADGQHLADLASADGQHLADLASADGQHLADLASADGQHLICAWAIHVWNFWPGVLSCPLMRGRRALGATLVAIMFAGQLASADTAGRLHEFVPPDPAEDLRFSATTLAGELPAALETPSGIAKAPDPERPPDTRNLYTGGTSDDTPDSRYEPDRDTRQPNIENYEDPFSPSTTPFKRLRAYDSLDERYVLRVANKGTELVPIGGTVDAGDESFYGDFSVELLPEDLVRIPTVGPGSRVIKMHFSPEVRASVLRDGADNWFLRGSERKRVRVVMQLAVQRASFGGEFADVSTEQLQAFVPTFAAHTEQAERVFEAVGVNRSMRPKQSLAKMVSYFRSFASSDQPPKTHGDIYLDLALSKKGVCRHRAFAFLVTALELGIPTRMVVNEAHAWVEVFDATLWHRIDLGGAALNLQNEADPTRPQHQPPEDPFPWPEGAEQSSGDSLASRGPTSSEPDPQSSNDPNGNGSSNSANSANGSSAPPGAQDPAQPVPANPDLPAATLELTLDDTAVKRGDPLKVKGRVLGQGRGCAGVRVDVVLKAGRVSRMIGSLSTDDAGRFEGTAVVPRDLTTGDYDVFVVTAGDKQRCGAGRAD